MVAPEGASAPAERQTGAPQNQLGPWLHGMARREEKVELTRDGSCADFCTHAAPRSLGVREGGATEPPPGGPGGSNLAPSPSRVNCDPAFLVEIVARPRLAVARRRDQR